MQETVPEAAVIMSMAVESEVQVVAIVEVVVFVAIVAMLVEAA